MEKVSEEDEKKITEKGVDSVEETRNDKDDERIGATTADRVDPTKEGSMGPSNSHTVTSNDPDFNESDMEDEEKVLEFFRRNTGFTPEVTERNSFPFMNKSEGMILHVQENILVETEQTSVPFETDDLGAENQNSVDILEQNKSSSASSEDIVDSSSNSDHDYSLSRYYFDGSLPISAHVEEFEIHQDDESPVPKDENQMPLLRTKQPVLQSTSWRNCCGLLELLRAAGTRNINLQ